MLALRTLFLCPLSTYSLTISSHSKKNLWGNPHVPYFYFLFCHMQVQMLISIYIYKRSFKGASRFFVSLHFSRFDIGDRVWCIYEKCCLSNFIFDHQRLYQKNKNRNATHYIFGIVLIFFLVLGCHLSIT